MWQRGRRLPTGWTRWTLSIAIATYVALAVAANFPTWANGPTRFVQSGGTSGNFNDIDEAIWFLAQHLA